MCQLHPIITIKTGYELYNNVKFDSGGGPYKSPKYFAFYEDYNKLIQREVKRNNIQGIYYLCSWVYLLDSNNSPWYDPMLEIALKDNNVMMVTALIVLYMWKYCQESRDPDSITLNDTIKFVSSNDKEAMILEFFCGNEDLDKEKFTQRIFSYGIDFDIWKAEFEAFSTSLT